MSDLVLFLGRQSALAYELLQQFQNLPELDFYPSLAGEQELRSLLLRLQPRLILVGPDIPQAADAQALRAILNSSYSPPLIFLQQAQTPAEWQASWQTALDWGASELISLAEADWPSALRQCVLTLMPLGRQSQLLRQSATLKSIHADPLPAAPCRLLLIGASTGGPQALARILQGLPADFAAPILIVQHLPEGFTHSLAARLQAFSRLPVREALATEPLVPGHVLIVPGNRQARCLRTGQLECFEALHLSRPSVDLALFSAIDAFHRDVLAVILTGMGQDGLEGVQRLKQVGGRCLAEHPSSCVVYGMPRAVIEAGLADRVVPLGRMASEIKSCVPSGRSDNSSSSRYTL